HFTFRQNQFQKGQLRTAAAIVRNSHSCFEDGQLQRLGGESLAIDFSLQCRDVDFPWLLGREREGVRLSGGKLAVGEGNLGGGALINNLGVGQRGTGRHG